MNQVLNQTTALTEWNPDSGAALPAHLADAAAALGTNIQDRMTVPSLSYEGKTWAIVKDGNKTKLQRKNEDGDMEPVPIMRAVVLNYNGDRGRAYYTGTYDPAKISAPKCWSADGKAPDASITEKESPLCNGCPQSIKGSKVQDGKEMIACSSHRMIALIPAFDLDFDPLRLKIAVTSDYDKELVEHGWFAFRQYGDYLKSRGVTHTALVVTKIKFDPNVAYPKLLFALDRPLSAAEVVKVIPIVQSAKVTDLLKETWTVAGTNGTPIDDRDIKPADAGEVPASQQVIESTTHAAVEASPPMSQNDTPPPKPTDPSHIAHAETEHELWWDGSAWVKPWALVASTPPAAAAPPPPPAPVAQPEIQPLPPKPSDPAHIAHGGTEHELWWDNEAWVKPWLGNVPTAASAATPAASAPASTPESASPTSEAGPTATTAASPSEGSAAASANTVPADVQSLLDKWTQ